MGLTKTLEQELCKEIGVPWLPKITGHLVRDAESRLLKPNGIDVGSYSTSRYLTSTAERPLDFVKFGSSDAGEFPLIECLEANVRVRYEALGLNFRAREAISPAICRTVYAAILKLRSMPSLYNSVCNLVRVIHVLDVMDDAYDVSHSDPRLPFSIFVSVPNNYTEISTIRVMESIVHEAMHLQLTLLENHFKFVKDVKSFVYSPWMNEKRPIMGVIHGIYVFFVIHTLYQKLLEADSLSNNEKEFISRRMKSIEKELKIANSGISESNLTGFGVSFRGQVCSI